MSALTQVPAAARFGRGSAVRSSETRREQARDVGGAERRRWGLRHVAALAAVVVALGFLAYQYREGIDLGKLGSNVHWGWATLAVAGAVLMQFGNAWNLTGASPTRLRFGRTVAVQFAGVLTRLVSPSAVGAAAINVQYLRRSGVGSVTAVGSVSVAQAVQVGSALIMFPVVAALTSRDLGIPVGSAPVWGVVAGVIALLVVAGFVVARRYPLVEARVMFALRELTTSLRVMVRNPARASLSIAGAFVVSAGLIGALWASVHAFGGELSIGLAACVLLVGTTAGNAVPVPGGIGTVEAALVAALGAMAGVPVAVALPAVAVFRLVTLWLQMPVGLVCAAWLRRTGAL